EYADLALFRVPRPVRKFEALYAAFESAIQSAGGPRCDVPIDDQRGLGRSSLRLRLQSNAGDRDETAIAYFAIFRRSVAEPKNRAWLALLRLHRRRRQLVRRHDRLNAEILKSIQFLE